MSRVLGDQLDLADVHHLGDHLQVVRVGGAPQHLQPLLAEPLEAVRRAARLERAAAQDLRAGALDGRGGGHHLLVGLRRARAGHDDHLVAADPHVVDRDDGVLGLEGAAGALVRLGDAQHLVHAVEDARSAPGSTLCAPTTPSTVRVAPDERCTSMPSSMSRAMTASICASVARSFITTTMTSFSAPVRSAPVALTGPAAGSCAGRLRTLRLALGAPRFVDDALEDPHHRFRRQRARQLGRRLPARCASTCASRSG